jgi:hypothetical protein
MADVQAASPGRRLEPSLSRPAPGRKLIAVSLVAGIVIAILWSAKLTDDDIGVNAASGMIGHNAMTVGIADSLAGILFAFAAGLAGTFTACNIAVFGAIGPLLNRAPSVSARPALRPLAWLALGAIVVASVYGAIGGAIGTRMPQLSKSLIGGQMPVRVLQSVIVFSVIGLAFIYLGLAAAGTVPDPFRRTAERLPYLGHVTVGMLIGAFLIGRPYPLFYKMFEFAAARHSAFYGALAFDLVVIGNMVLMTVVFLIVSASGLPRWLAARPGRVQRFTASALLIAGAFTFAYWGLRVPAQLGYGWFPVVAW